VTDVQLIQNSGPAKINLRKQPAPPKGQRILGGPLISSTQPLRGHFFESEDRFHTEEVTEIG